MVSIRPSVDCKRAAVTQFTERGCLDREITELLSVSKYSGYS